MEFNKDCMEKLMQMSSKVVEKKLLEEKVTIITDTLKEIISADRCSIFVYDKNTNSFWTMHADGINYIEIPKNKGIVSDVFDKKETIIENSMGNNELAIDTIDNYKVESMISMPILGFDNDCIGVVQLLNKENGFDENDIKVLKFVINHFTTFIQMMVHEN